MREWWEALKWEARAGFTEPSCDQALVFFPNNWGVSILRWAHERKGPFGDFVYTSYEVAVIEQQRYAPYGYRMAYDTALTDDVVKFKTESDVYTFAMRVARLDSDGQEPPAPQVDTHPGVFTQCPKCSNWDDSCVCEVCGHVKEVVVEVEAPKVEPPILTDTGYYGALDRAKVPFWRAKPPKFDYRPLAYEDLTEAMEKLAREPYYIAWKLASPPEDLTDPPLSSPEADVDPLRDNPGDGGDREVRIPPKLVLDNLLHFPVVVVEEDEPAPDTFRAILIDPDLVLPDRTPLVEHALRGELDHGVHPPGNVGGSPPIGHQVVPVVVVPLFLRMGEEQSRRGGDAFRERIHHVAHDSRIVFIPPVEFPEGIRNDENRAGGP